MMSTGGITRMLFFEDQNESFDTQDALDSLLEELKCGDGGDTTSFLSEDDVWIAETVTIPDQVDDSFMKENNGDVSPNQVLENEKSMVKEKELEKEVEKEKKKKKKKHSQCVRCSIIQKIMIDGVQRDTGLVIEENIDPFMISMFSKRKCAQCKKILTIFST